MVVACRTPGLVDDWRCLFGRRHARRQLQDADVAEVDFGAFGLQAEIALLDRGVWLTPLTNLPLTDSFTTPSTQTTS